MNDANTQLFEQANQQSNDLQGQSPEIKKNVVIRVIGILMLIWSIILLISFFVGAIFLIPLFMSSAPLHAIVLVLTFMSSIILLILSIGLISYKKWAINYYIVYLVLIVISLIINLIIDYKDSGMIAEGISFIIFVLLFVYIYKKKQDLV